MAKKTTATSVLQQIETDLRSFLSQHQQLIFNERELQLRIAQFLMNTGCYSNVYPEYNGITWLDKNWRNNQTDTDKGRRPDIAFSGQYPILPWTIANIGRWNNGSNVTLVFNYTYIIV